MTKSEVAEQRKKLQVKQELYISDSKTLLASYLLLANIIMIILFSDK